jgi:hypothetical protein
VSRPSVARVYDYWLGGKDKDKELAERLRQTVTHTRFWNHDAAALKTMLGELEPVGPGVSEVRRWVTGTGGEPEGKPVYALAGVGLKSR